MPKDESENTQRIFQDILKEKKSIIDLENWNIHKNGSLVCLLTNGYPIIDTNGNLIGYRGADKDITERKKAENDLKESENKFKTIIENSPDAIFLVNKQGKYVYANQAASDLLGYSINEILKLNIKDIGEQGVSEKRFQELMQNGKMHAEMSLRKKDGGRVLIDINAIVLPNGLIYGSCRDLTKQKDAEKALRDSEERFNLAMNATNDGLFDWNLETNEIYYSPGWKKMLGYEDHELPNDFSIWENLTEPEDVKKSWDLQQKLIAKQIDRFVMEFKMKHKKGHWIDILSRAEAIFNNEGKAVRMIGTHSDITDRKRAEEEIRKKNIEFRKLSANVPGMIFQFIRRPDGSFSVPLSSEGIESIFGCKQEDVLEDFTPIANAIHVEDADRVMNEIEYSARNLTHFICEFRVQLPGKAIQWIFARSTPELQPDGSIIWYGFNIDITERKQIEESQKRMVMMLDIAPSSIIVHDFDSNFLYANQKTFDWHGYTREEFMSLSLKQIDSPNSSELITARMKTLQECGEASFQVEHLRKDGSILPLEIYTLITKWGDKKAILSLGTDITYRLQAEESLKESEEKYRLLHENAGIGIGYYKPDGMIISFNKIAAMHLGGVPEDFEGKSIHDIFPKEEADFYFNRIKKAAITNEPTVYEDRVPLPIGDKYFLSTFSKITDSNNEITGIQIISQDISEQKNTENELLKTRSLLVEAERIGNVGS